MLHITGIYKLGVFRYVRISKDVFFLLFRAGAKVGGSGGMAPHFRSLPPYF